MKINQISPNTLLIILGDTISKETHHKVQIVNSFLNSKDDSGIIEIIPSYTTVLVIYDILIYDFLTLQNYINSSIDFQNSIQFDDEIITVDVYYGLEVGFDLERIANINNVAIQDIIEIHSNKIYDIYSIGFLPGFGFLGDVDKKIATPRLNTPRKKVPQGSVAIADKQTAIYPSDSPGGWNIIGQTTKKLFFKNNPLDSITPLSVGKKIKFNPISKEKFLDQGGIL
jgi:KipI family sensor histidine kinase inhibitor